MVLKGRKTACNHPVIIFILMLMILILAVYCCNDSISGIMKNKPESMSNQVLEKNKEEVKEKFGIGLGAVSVPAAEYRDYISQLENGGNRPRGDLLMRDAPVVVQQENPGIQRTTYEINSLDRIYNPLRYPYKSVPYYRYEATYPKPQYSTPMNAFFSPESGVRPRYPDLNLPAPVVGCGSRREPCYGGTQEVIPNMLPPVDVSENNIAPITLTTAVNISTRGPLGQPQQVGALYKIFGNENEIHPLFGRRKYPNSDKWDYYTMAGKYGVKMEVRGHRNCQELGNNDEVEIRGLPGKYRVTIYESDFPQYIPYV
jgi:hypothetical protein